MSQWPADYGPRLWKPFEWCPHIICFRWNVFACWQTKKDFQERKANQISLQLIGLSLGVINEMSRLLIKFSWSVLKRDDRRSAPSCLLNQSVKTQLPPKLNLLWTQPTYAHRVAHAQVDARPVAHAHNRTPIKIRPEVDKYVGPFQVVTFIEWLTRLLIWCDIINYSQLGKQMGQRACGEEMGARIINSCGWLDRASPLAQQEAVRGFRLTGDTINWNEKQMRSREKNATSTWNIWYSHLLSVVGNVWWRQWLLGESSSQLCSVNFGKCARTARANLEGK